jgi:hypothetical protein
MQWSHTEEKECKPDMARTEKLNVNYAVWKKIKGKTAVDKISWFKIVNFMVMVHLRIINPYICVVLKCVCLIKITKSYG